MNGKNERYKKRTPLAICEGRFDGISRAQRMTINCFLPNITAKEVVQIYIEDESCSCERLYKELNVIKKVSFKVGKTKIVSLNLDSDVFAFYNKFLKSVH